MDQDGRGLPRGKSKGCNKFSELSRDTKCKYCNCAAAQHIYLTYPPLNTGYLTSTAKTISADVLDGTPFMTWSIICHVLDDIIYAVEQLRRTLTQIHGKKEKCEESVTEDDENEDEICVLDVTAGKWKDCETEDCDEDEDEKAKNFFAVDAEKWKVSEDRDEDEDENGSDEWKNQDEVNTDLPSVPPVRQYLSLSKGRDFVCCRGVAEKSLHKRNVDEKSLYKRNVDEVCLLDCTDPHLHFPDQGRYTKDSRILVLIQYEQTVRREKSYKECLRILNFLRQKRIMNRRSYLKYRKTLDYFRLPHGQKIKMLETMSENFCQKFRKFIKFLTDERILSQTLILDHLHKGDEMRLISYHRLDGLLKKIEQRLLSLSEALQQHITRRTIYNPVIERMRKLTQGLTGPVVISGYEKNYHSLQSEEEDNEQYFHECVCNSQRPPLARILNPKMSLITDNDGFMPVKLSLLEDFPHLVSLRCKKKAIYSYINSKLKNDCVLRDSNISEGMTWDLSMTNKNRKPEYAKNFEHCVHTSVKVFFKTKNMTFEQKEDDTEMEYKMQYELDVLAQQKEGSVEDVRNVRDLKDKKKSDLYGIIWPPLNQLPLPSVSRDAVVGYVEGQSQIIEDIELREILRQLASNEIPGPQITMKYEMLRLCTMKSFPGRDKPFAIRIAGAGFYYAGHQDQVICYCCGNRKDNWVPGDIPLLIHQNMASNCSFLMHNALVNVPVRKANSTASADIHLLAIQRSDGSNQSDTAQGESSLMLPSEQIQVKGASGTHQMLVTNKTSAPNQLMLSRGQNILDSPQTPFVHAYSAEDPPPKYPQYAVKTMRINSFQGWSAELQQKPEEMADCGFYYAGFSDCVRCFYCGVGLRHWMSEDDPWIEHARWSISCVYVRKMKGEEFVSLVKMAVEIAEREEAAGNNTDTRGNQPPQNMTEAGQVNTVKEDFHGNNSTRSITARDSACSTGAKASDANGATVSTPSHGNAEIQKYLLTDAAQSVLDMGYQPKMVLQAIEKALIKKGTEELTGQVIMEALFAIEEEDKAKARPPLSQQSAQENESNPKANDNGEESKKQDGKQDGEGAEGGTVEGLQIDPEKIRREHKELYETTLCKICLDNTSSVVFLPCGHLVTCPDCAPAMRKCPICRTLIKGTVKIFFG